MTLGQHNFWLLNMVVEDISIWDKLAWRWYKSLSDIEFTRNFSCVFNSSKAKCIKASHQSAIVTKWKVFCSKRAHGKYHHPYYLDGHTNKMPSLEELDPNECWNCVQNIIGTECANIIFHSYHGSFMHFKSITFQVSVAKVQKAFTVARLNVFYASQFSFQANK